MTGTTRLALPYITASQAGKEVTHNADLDAIDARFDAALTKSLSGGNGTVTLAELQACALILATGASVARDLTLAAFTGERMISNTGSATVTVKIGSGSAALTAGSWGFVIGDGTTNGITLLVATFSGGTLTTTTNMSGVPLNLAKGADIASASTTDIASATGNHAKITGTTTITALGTVQAGARRTVEFGGVLTLTYNATSLILPTGADITTAAGDTAEFVSLGSGNWKCLWYARASGAPISGAAGNATQLQGYDVDSAAPTNNYVLTWDSASSKWKAKVTGAAAGGLTLLEHYDASGGVSSLDFTTGLSSTYEEYLLVLTNLYPQTNGDDLWLRVGTGGGPTYQTSAYEYETSNFYANGNAAPSPGSHSASDSKIILWQDNDATVSRGNSFHIHISDPLSASLEKQFNWTGNGTFSAVNTRRYRIDGVGSWDSTTALTALRVMYSSGNIASGRAYLFGFAKS